MGNFFSVDGGLYRFMSRLWDMLQLNFMWFICSLPIVTMGAATTAAYTITLKMVDDEEGYIVGPFWKEFKANIKKGSIMGVILLVAMYALYLDFQLFQVVEEYSFAFLFVFVLGLVLTVFHFIYAFPLLARYENSVINTMRNSFRISLKYIPKTIFLIIALLIEYILFFQFHKTLLMFGLILGPACFILTISGFARQFFRNIERENEIRDEEAKIAKAEERAGKHS